MEPKKTGLTPSEIIQRELGELEERAASYRRDALAAERALIFFRAWVRGGCFHVPLPGGETREVRPPVARTSGPAYTILAARSEAEYWARQIAS